MSILDAIRAKLDTLTAKQRSIAQYLLEARMRLPTCH